MTTFLARQPENSLNRFVILDAQDWMEPDQIAGLWKEIARVGQPGTRIIFRSGASGSPVETALPSELKGKMMYQQETSSRLFKQDRSAIYGGFHLYTMN
jgi:S-adenosylmethionine-diacylglycerol 3-amino-3-carboxypropyl transferase